MTPPSKGVMKAEQAVAAWEWCCNSVSAGSAFASRRRHYSPDMNSNQRNVLPERTWGPLHPNVSFHRAGSRSRTSVNVQPP